jgi:hypothetical protein
MNSLLLVCACCKTFSKTFFPASSGVERTWVGLTHSGKTCTNSGCSDNGEWMDGSDFSYDPTFMKTFQLYEDPACPRIRDDYQIYSYCQVGKTYPVLCQFECIAGNY